MKRFLGFSLLAVAVVIVQWREIRGQEILYVPVPGLTNQVQISVSDLPSYRALTNWVTTATRFNLVTNVPPIPPDTNSPPIPPEPTNTPPPIPPQTSGFYASPNAAANGDGSIENPWRLQVAFTKTIAPGSTLWLRGGTYKGLFNSQLKGTPTAPIVVRAFPGERAQLDGGTLANPEAILGVFGAHTWFWGIEVMSSQTTRTINVPGSSPPISVLPLAEGVVIGNNSTIPGIRFINMIVHDTRQGFSVWKGATDAEVYGCLIYNNGWVAPDRGHGHGIYTQNVLGIRNLEKNIMINQMSHGIQAYGSDQANANNIQNWENTFLANWDRDWLIGGGNVANNPSILRCMTWTLGGAAQLGQIQGVTAAVLIGNYQVNPAGQTVQRFRSVTPSQVLSFKDSTYIGSVEGFSPSTYPQNTYISQKPTSGLKVFVSPNKYETGRANITIYNYSKAAAVTVDISTSGLTNQQRFIIRDAQNWWGPLVLEGTYAGAPVSIPCVKTTATPIIGTVPAEYQHQHTGPEFETYVLLTK